MYRKTIKIPYPAFGDTVKDMLYAYSYEVERAIATEAKKSAQQCRIDIQRAAPKRSGTYAKTWAVKTDTKQSHRPTFVVHAQRPGYQLAHLLERSHRIANQYGDNWGRTAPKAHIAPAAEKNSATFTNNVVRQIKNLS